MIAEVWQWVSKSVIDGSRRLLSHRELALCCLLFISLPCGATDAAADDAQTRDAIHHFEDGLDCTMANDFACARRDAAWLGRSPFPEIGKVLLGRTLYREKRYADAITTLQSVYPVLPREGASPLVRRVYVVAHSLAASTTGESLYQLKRPDAQTLAVLLEGVRLPRADGRVVDDEALYLISVIFMREDRPGLSFGFGLEGYDIMRTRYAKEAPGPEKKLMGRYLHAEEFRFALLLARMDDLDGSRVWLAKALSYKDGRYLEKARKVPKLKEVLDSIEPATQRSAKADGK